MRSKEELQNLDVAGDTQLLTEEKETTLTINNDDDSVTIYSDISTMIKWVLSIEESEIIDHRITDEKLVGIKANVPRGVIKLQSSARKSSNYSQMVSYGPL